MDSKRTISDLKQRQSLPLPAKVAMTQQRIMEWVKEFGEDGVYVSFSGGKDSTVLLHIVRQMFPCIEAVFVDTGLEYPEIKQFVRQHENVTILRPKMGFKDVICNYGYPIISKTVSHGVAIARNKPDGNVARRQFGDDYKSKFALKQWRPLTKTDFKISDKCCGVMKKAPAKLYEHETEKKPMTAQMACESLTREKNWAELGCNAFDLKRPVSNPMSVWTENDVLQYIKENSIEICSVYGDIVPEGGQLALCEGDCKLCTTGCKRTGCVFCGYGAHLEKGEGRFQRLKRTHPKLYAYCIGGGAYDPEDGLWKPDKNGLGMAHVFDELCKQYGENFIRYK